MAEFSGDYQRHLRDQSTKTVLAWLSENDPGDNIEEIVKKTGLHEKTCRVVLTSLVGRGKVIRQRVKKRSGNAIVSEVRYRCATKTLSTRPAPTEKR
jgi:predicted transcriptional regulator